ncbi:hypothetical protein GCM10008957_23170 [Deinococcus ruber]|uniref:Uncharacterized protein n=1 Tax=Deinococcus ruber TaxID=1848197 RepID=A0A918F896_9DEIO|nr:hypothetical protein GCM10008957_23170 [Deinococcus ruber]
MRLPEQKKIGLQALQADLVLCDGQLERLGVSPDLFPGRLVSLKPNVSTRFGERLVTFRAVNQATLTRHDVYTLAHLAGTAEIRARLQAPADRWQSGAIGHLGNEPDARGWLGEQLVMVEYDACHYTKATIRDKMRAFRTEGQVVWGTSSALRAERIARAYPQAQVFYTPWWESPAERAATVAGGNGGRRAKRMADNLARPR